MFKLKKACIQTDVSSSLPTNYTTSLIYLKDYFWYRIILIIDKHGNKMNTGMKTTLKPSPTLT